MDNVKKVAKAVTAFIVTAAGVIAAAPATGGEVDTTVVITAVVLGLASAISVWAVPNKAAA